MVNIRYASIRSMDISNGEGVGVALFVQGCHFHCPNCFNPETWDFNGGKEWTEEVKNKFLELVERPYIKRVSLLGGECLAEENLDGVLDLVTEINKRYNTPQDRAYVKDKNNNILTDFPDRIRLSKPKKSIWLYTGYKWSDIINYETLFNNVMTTLNYETLFNNVMTTHNSDILYDYHMWKRKSIISQCDVLVDGKYIESDRDISLKWCGSSNQKVISVKDSLTNEKIVLLD